MATTASVGSSKALRTALSVAMVSTMAGGLCYFDIDDAFAASADTSWYSSSAKTYTLKDARDLAGLAQLVNKGTSFAGKTVQFKAKTTLKLDGSYTPIGNARNSFDGTFDGQGLKVTGMDISSGTSYLGLFGNCGAGSLIKDVSVTGSITASVGSGSKTIIHHVGGVIGNSKGSLDNCDSSVKIKISSGAKSTVDANAVISRVGGVAGAVTGNVTGCDTTKNASVSVTCTSAPASDDVTWVAGWVGGVVGDQGPDVDKLETLANPSSITNCTNKAKVTLVSSAKGKPDRFGNPTAACTQYLGGIAGYSSGNISSCTNSAAIDSAYYKKGKAALSYGCVAVGGIVGGYRIGAEVATAGDTDDPGLRYQKKFNEEAKITLSDCVNTALVFGLGQAGGIVGQGGSYTLITRSYNTGDVKGSRYTKPSPGGVAGRTYGDISYCYNTGNIETTTGGGYYAAGIVGMLHSIGKDSNDEAIVPEVWACYNTGYVLTNGSGYRSGSVVGELDGGYIHDTYSLKNRAQTNSISGLSDYTGTIVNVKEVDEKKISSADLIATLNACCDKEGWVSYYTLPAGKSYGDTKAKPVLASASNEGATDLSGKTATVSSGNKASYSGSIDPVPTVKVTYNGKTLVQNADYRVIAQENTKGANVGSTKYTAQIEGIGNYTGRLATTASYTIVQASIKTCTLTVASMYYNYAPQKPSSVVLYDDGGNVVDASQYTWDVDKDKFGKKSGSRVQYQDAVDKNATEGDPIIVTAVSGGNYTGTKTFNVFRIKPVPLVMGKSGESPNPNQDTLKYGDVTYTDPSGKTTTWKFDEVCSTGTNNAIGDADLRGKVKIKYTGEPIKLGLTGISYMGKELKQIMPGDAWYESTKEWGYKLLYGNPNPENAADAKDELASVTNVTEGKTDKDGNPTYAVMTIRAAPYSNFDNYVTLWFTITPASIEDDVTIEDFEDTVSYISGKQDAVKLTYNGKTLKEGKDYTATYSYEGTQATVTYKGIGNYNGEVTKSFTFTGKVVAAPKSVKVASSKKAKATIKWAALSGVDGYEVSYQVAGGKWATKVVKGAKKTSLTVRAKSKKTCKVQVRGYKKSGSVTSCTTWSEAASKKVK